ncbi:MAG: hypothetical protein ABI655_12740 [Phenylobacterium sp.]
MRLYLILATIGLMAAVASSAQAQAVSPKPAVAVSVERFAVQADYRSPGFGQGYGPQARHRADCLASLRTYDPKTDRFTVRPGVSRRCTL